MRAVLLAAVLAVTFVAAPATASPAQPGGLDWVVTAWNMHLLDQADPSAAAFFGAGSFGTQSDPTSATYPAKDGLGAAPVLVYDSFARFSADVAAGAIIYPYRWVLYDPEAWNATPTAEQQDPGTYLRQFAQLAHARGYQVIEAPARDLGNAATTCAKQQGESNDQWYVRCQIAGQAAAYADVVVVQDQVNTTNLPEYDWLFGQAQAQAQAANPYALVDAEVSTNYGTPAQMAAAAQSVPAAGFYVSMTSNAVSAADQFFQAMR